MRSIPRTGSLPSGSRSNVQDRASWVGPGWPSEMTSSRPRSRQGREENGPNAAVNYSAANTGAMGCQANHQAPATTAAKRAIHTTAGTEVARASR